MRIKIHQDELPYPGLKFATTKRGGRHVEYAASAITAGSGQYREGFLRSGGRVADSEGVLAFGDEGFAFFADSEETFIWSYEDVASFKTGKTLVPIVKKFNVRMRDGSKASFRIGPQLLANASYIFAKVLAQNEAAFNVRAADKPPWRVQEGSNEVEGFYVVGYGPDPALPNIPHAPHLYGPYSTFDDAEAVVAAKDPTVRPLDEEALRRERQETDEWMRHQKEQAQSQPQKTEELPPPPPTEEKTEESPLGPCTVTTTSTRTAAVIESVERASGEPAILYAQALLWREKGLHRKYEEAVRIVVRDPAGHVIFDESSISRPPRPQAPPESFEVATSTDAAEPAVCSICHLKVEGYGNNPTPVANLSVSDRACDWCNEHVVGPVRRRKILDRP
jgi:hypothetical protein